MVTFLTHFDDFKRALEKGAAESSRAYPEFLNGQALRLASFAIQQTERADSSKIAAKLGQSSSRITNKRTGKRLKTPRKVYSSKLSLDLYRIVNWRRKRAGLAPLGGRAMSGPARRLRAAALRSTGFIASGWIYAVRGLAALVGYKDVARPRQATRISGDPKGWVNPARFAVSDVVACTIGNSSLISESDARTGRRTGDPMPVAQAGLSMAAQLTAKDMMEHLRRKLQAIW